MTDVFTKKKRSQIMSSVRSRNTGPERRLWSALAALRLKSTRHAADVPGRPDAALRNRKVAVFVHGCFWHGHKACNKGRRMPKTNRRFWLEKIEYNRRRDRAAARKLSHDGWRRLVLWECQMKDPLRTRESIRKVVKMRPARAAR